MIRCATRRIGCPILVYAELRTAESNTGLIAAMKLPGGTQASPFVAFNDLTTPDILADPGIQRYPSMIHKPSEMIMIVEASSPNWYDQTASTSQPPLYLRRRAYATARRPPTSAMRLRTLHSSTATSGCIRPCRINLRRSRCRIITPKPFSS